MPALTIADLSRRIAEYVGDEGFSLEHTCGGVNIRGGQIVGYACPACVRLPERVPKPYAESLDLLVPVVERWREKYGVWWSIWGAGSATASIVGVGAWGASPAEALARVFVAALERWGE